MKSKLRIEDFLELQKNIKTKLHFRDACGGSVVELESIDNETVEDIKKYFDEKGINIQFSNDKKYVYFI